MQKSAQNVFALGRCVGEVHRGPSRPPPPCALATWTRAPPARRLYFCSLHHCICHFSCFLAMATRLFSGSLGDQKNIYGSSSSCQQLGAAGAGCTVHTALGGQQVRSRFTRPATRVCRFNSLPLPFAAWWSPQGSDDMAARARTVRVQPSRSKWQRARRAQMGLGRGRGLGIQHQAASRQQHLPGTFFRSTTYSSQRAHSDPRRADGTAPHRTGRTSGAPVGQRRRRRRSLSLSRAPESAPEAQGILLT